MIEMVWLMAVLITTTPERAHQEGGNEVQWVLWPTQYESKAACEAAAAKVRGTSNGLDRYRVSWVDATCTYLPKSAVPEDYRLLSERPR